MADGQLKLTRAQLAAFLKDHQSIKQFEQLFKTVDALAPDFVNEVNIAAENAGSRAQQALDALQRFTNVLELLILAPREEQDKTLSLDYLDMRANAPHTSLPRRLAWNDVDQTLDLGLEYGVTQQIGQEVYARVGNTTGATIPNGTVVGFAGATSNAILVEPYLADGAHPSLYVLGVMTHDLPDSGEKGYCTTWGFVRGIDTSAFAAGDILYPSPTVAGAFTNTKPTAPNNVIPIAACITSDAANGVIFVRPTIEQQKYYGIFTKTTDQSPAVINTEYLLTFDNTQVSNGVVIGATTSRIIVPEAGLYNFDATIQLTSGSAAAKNIWAWFKKNGVTVTNSARIVTSDINGGYIPIALSQFFSLADNDYIEIAFASNDTNVTVDSVAATAFAPAAPAIVLNVTQIQQ